MTVVIDVIPVNPPNPTNGYAYDDLSNVTDADFDARVNTAIGFIVFAPSSTSDQSSRLLAAIAEAVDANVALWLQPNSYIRCDFPLTIPANMQWQGNGATVDFSHLTTTNNSIITGMKPCMLVTGAVGATAYNLASDCLRKASTATLGAGAGANFAVRDRLLLESNTTYNYDGSTLAKYAEAKILEALPSADVLQFSTPVDDDYTTAATGRVYKLALVGGVEIFNTKFIGTNTTSDLNCCICASETEALVVEGCTFTNFDYITVGLFGTNLWPRIQNNRIDGVRLVTTGNNFYGIAIYGTGQWFVITGNTGQQLRHLCITSVSSNIPGRPRFGVVTSNVMWNAEWGGTLPSYAYEPRMCKYTIWANNVADGCQSGFMCESGDKLICDNLIKNYRGAAIGMGDTQAGRDMQNLSIINNRIETCIPETSITTIGIYAPTNANQVRRNLVIKGNTIREFVGATNSYGVRLDPCLTSEGVIVEGNMIFGPATDTAPSTAYGVYAQTVGVEVLRNSFYGLGNCVRGTTAANDLGVDGNSCTRYETGVDSIYAFVIEGTDARVCNNRFNGQRRAIHLTVDSVTARYWNNDIKRASATTISDFGTGNVGAPSNATTPSLAQTIAAGVVTGNNATRFATLDTEGAGASDDLDTFNGTVAGQAVTICAANSARTVVVKDGTGNLRLAGDCSLDDVGDTISLISTGTLLYETGRSNNA